MGFTSFLKMKYTTKRPSPATPPSPPASSWSPWPSSCKQPMTESFCAKEHDDSTESWFTSSSDDDYSSSDGFSTAASEEEAVETVFRGIALESRLLYDLVGTTSSILEESKAGAGFPFNESTVLVVESKDPYFEFRTSIKEMAVAHGLHDFRYLRELLGWYLKVNDEKMHEFIVEAFVDLLL